MVPYYSDFTTKYQSVSQLNDHGHAEGDARQVEGLHDVTIQTQPAEDIQVIHWGRGSQKLNGESCRCHDHCHRSKGALPPGYTFARNVPDDGADDVVVFHDMPEPVQQFAKSFGLAWHRGQDQGSEVDAQRLIGFKLDHVIKPLAVDNDPF